LEALRSEAGEAMVLQNNYFIEKVLPNAILRKLANWSRGLIAVGRLAYLVYLALVVAVQAVRGIPLLEVSEVGIAINPVRSFLALGPTGSAFACERGRDLLPRPGRASCTGGHAAPSGF
jgi:hypothetical protein